MPQLEAQARVLEEWFRLPESRRMHATDAVAFAFRLLQDRPEMVARLPVHNDAANHDIIVVGASMTASAVSRRRSAHTVASESATMIWACRSASIWV